MLKSQEASFEKKTGDDANSNPAKKHPDLCGAENCE